MARAEKPCRSSAPNGNLPRAYYHLHSLLQTVRALAAHEDAMCSLLAEMERTGKVSANVRRELAHMMDALPLECLQQEIDALAEERDERAA